MNLRSNWRVVALVFLLVMSGIALFVPGVGLGTSADASLTNLQYGLDLSGGTRLRAPLVGVTAEEVAVEPGEQATLAEAIAAELQNVERTDVEVRPGAGGVGTVEVFDADVSRDELAAALEAVGASYEEVREGVTAETRRTAVEVIRRKIDESGLAGGTVQQSTTPTGEHFIVIEVPNRNRSEVTSLVEERGVVVVSASFPDDGTVRNETVLTQEDIATVGPVQDPNSQLPSPHVPVTLTEQGARDFAEAMRQYGFTSSRGTDACLDAYPPDERYCIDTVLDGTVVYSASMSPGLASTIQRNEFVESRSFVITATNRSDATELRINLRAGALPAPLNLDAGTVDFISPSLAENFKLFSLLTGIMAVLAVAGVVFLRYGAPTVAAPMVVTALSEVVILLGFAAGVGLALDLSHIAGLIAVIGTGVDDLIIIADEVMAEGSVSSGRVFRNRFRKAFWVIGAAAVTTIVAMSPLAVLSLGDLRGFAIVTILGVIVGVVITRPAYGDILRELLTEH